jgi:hypothetical protein
MQHGVYVALFEGLLLYLALEPTTSVVGYYYAVAP